MKKKAAEREPEFFASGTNIPTVNYNVYYMKPLEKLGYFLLAFVVGAAVGWLFYGGIGKDAYGQPTTTTRVLDIVIPCIVGFIAGKLFIPIRTQSIIDKRRSKLKHQFRDMLDSLTVAVGAGENISNAFVTAKNELSMQYDGNAYILKELEVIITDMNNAINVEDILMDFGNRSGIDDIKSFASVFAVSYRKGGNMKDIIRNTHNILSDKMEIGEDIETLVTSNKMEQNIMIVMPVMLIGMIKFASPDFAANFVSSTGLASTTIALVLFVAAYFIGKKVLSIKI